MRTTAFRAWVAAVLLAAAGVPSWAAPAQSLPGNLPLRRDAEPVSDGSLWLPSLVLLGLVGAAGGYVAWRRGGLGGAGTAAARRHAPALVRGASQALTPQASVHTVQWDGEEFLLGCTPQQVTLLARRALPARGDGTP